MNGNLQTESDPWFEEGFAEYFSSIEVDSKQVRVGKVPEDEYRILQQLGMIKIADLFKVVQNSSTYNESGDHRTSFYAESGMLMHYIYDNQLMVKVAAYFDLKGNKHVPVEDAIQQAFGMSARQFDKVLRDYASSGRYKYYPIPAPASISADKYTVTPLKPADSAAVLADIHLHSRDYQERALSEFQGILKSDPNNAAACRGLGYGYLQQQDFNRANEYFKRASQLDSKDPRVHYYSALLTFREGGMGVGADIATMTKELETAINLDSSYADSYALLAFAQMTAGDSARALATMRKALEISPRNESYLYNLANLYLANRQPDQAIAILGSLRVTDNPMLAAQVAGMLEQARQFQKTLEVSRNGTEPATLFSDRDREGPEMPQEKEASSAAAPVSAASGPTAPVKKDATWGPPKFIHGLLSSVDCSTEPAAVLTLMVGAKTLKLSLADRNHVILIGSDQFSCSWSKRKVAVNYRESATGETSVMSVELQ